MAECNILLLGESGVGKTLLINSFNYYLNCNDWDEVRSSDIKCVIPCSFTVTDDYDVVHQIQSGKTEDDDKYHCKIYQSHHKNQLTQLIYTPALRSDTSKEILKFVIENVKELHAIILLLNTDQREINQELKTGFLNLLANFHKSIVDNLLFLFTCSESSCYKVGEVRQPLTQFLSTLKNPKSEFDNQLGPHNVFCVDNKWLKFLLAEKQDVIFNPDDISSCKRAYQKSAQHVQNMLKYVNGSENNEGLKSHSITDVINIEDIKIMTNVLKPFLRRILQQTAHVSEYMLEAEGSDAENSSSSIEICKENSVNIFYTDVVCSTCTGKICCDECVVAPSSLRYFCPTFDIFTGSCRICGCHVDRHYKKLKDPRVVAAEQSTTHDVRLTMSEEKKKIESEFFRVELALNQLKKYLVANTLVVCTDQLMESEWPELSELDVPVPDIDDIWSLKDQLFQLELYGHAIHQSYNNFHQST